MVRFNPLAILVNASCSVIVFIYAFPFTCSALPILLGCASVWEWVSLSAQSILSLPLG
jgi:hypothetical protein